MTITFHTEEGLGFSLKEKKKVKTWIEMVLKKESKSIQKISFLFCSDKYLLTINLRFLQHDTYTNIITFDYSDDKKSGGEILISVARVAENALTYKEPFQRELHRTIIHGVLHLCGYNDKTTNDKRVMRSKEDEYLDWYFPTTT